MSKFDRLVKDYNILKIPTMSNIDRVYLNRRITRVINTIDSRDQMVMAYKYCRLLLSKYACTNNVLFRQVLVTTIEPLMYKKNQELSHGCKGECR